MTTKQDQEEADSPSGMTKKLEDRQVDQLTKRDLKQDHFVTTTGNGLEWASENRRSVIVTASLLLAVIVVLVAIGVIANRRADAASEAFGQAIETEQTPLAVPGQPALPGVATFANIKDRATAANAQFKTAADKYGFMKDGKNAQYFVGLTYMEMGQNASAEDALKKVAGSWNGGNVAALAKFALADLYRSTGRNGQAEDLYNQLTAKPTDAVPAGEAQLQLGELFESEGKVEQAKKIYAQLKDKDAKGAAGLVAAQKLNPGAAAAGAQPQL